MLGWGPWLLVTLSACANVFGLDKVSLPADAPVRAPRTPFGVPVEVTELTSTGSHSDDPSLRDDQLELYFNSDRTGSVGDNDIWYSTRPSVSDPWSVPQRADPLNTLENDNAPRLRGDGLELYFAYATGTNFNLFRATRSDTLSPWNPRVAIAELNSSEPDYEASVTTDGLMVFFGSQRSGNPDIWMARRDAPGDPWGAPTPVAELNTEFIDDSPFTRDGLTMYFSTSRPGSFGSTDLWVATRPSLDDPFDAPEPLDELNSLDYEEDVWTDEAGQVIYFASARNGPFRIFMASR